ncbi:MAG: fructose-specific PTS transporter subunit EIIC [Gemmiger sp.]|nr:fructose-specific PTS transporter subunit EIIC [Gemmiger sp.]
MHITQLLRPGSILLGAGTTDKAAAIHTLVGLMAKSGNLADPAAFEQAVLAREAQSTTGVGGGLAIPHAKSASVTAPGLAALTLPAGLAYGALDGAPVRLLFLVAAPQDANNLHIEVLAELARLLMEPGFRERLLAAPTPEDFLQVMAAATAPGDAPTFHPSPAPPLPEVVAVTACPTGIAHTYMAAEALLNKAQEMGIYLKVETNGASGVQNELTPAEIAACHGVIVAADKGVEMARFRGKPVLSVPVSEGLQNPARLLQAAVAGQAPLYRPTTPPASSRPTPPDAPAVLPKEKPWHILYKQLMGGVANMLPLVIAGGISLALAYLFDRANLGTTTFGSGNPLSAFLKMLGDYSFTLMYPVLAGGIAYTIAGRTALPAGLVGGLLAGLGMTMRAQPHWVPSGFWGAILAGFAAGYGMLLLHKLLSPLPQAMDSPRTVLLYPTLSVLPVGALMVFWVNPWVGAFNQWLYLQLSLMDSEQKLLLGCLLGLMMAVDFGGPLSKAAYLFATAGLVAGEYGIMAAVMAGGMVPPLGVALACTFFKSRFSYRGQQTTLSNYIMGLSFITEGVIPFALKDPLRVIPACMVGSTLAGGLTMAFHCGCPVPHGGVYVVGLMTNPLHFLLALALGSAATMLLLALLKPPLTPAQQAEED